MLKSLQRFLFYLLTALLLLFLLYQAFLYSLVRENMPQGLSIAGLNASGLSTDELVNQLNARYYAPITIIYQQEQVEINPAAVGFTLDMEQMLARAEEIRTAQSFWEGYTAYLLERSFSPQSVPLIAAHDQQALREQLQDIADFLDRPATAPQLRTGGGIGGYQPGEPGFVSDVDSTLPAAEMALYQIDPAERQAEMILESQEAIPFNIQLLEEQLQQQIDTMAAEGIVGSVFVMDLATGEEVGINADVAMSALSVLKIAIFVDAYRVLNRPPNEYEQELFYNTAVQSSNFGANLLLHVIAQQDNTYLGADLLTESMQRLGLDNTFMAVPYDAVAVSTRPTTYETPANSDPNLPTNPDPARQTTAEDMGTLLSMIYYCAQGNGALMAVFENQVTPEECQAIIDLMILNEEGNLIRFGVPAGVPVSHKHGWDFLTHSDAGIVFTPGGDFVFVAYVTNPNTDWFTHEIGFNLIREMTQTTYNFFNFGDPYAEDVRVRAEREAAAREAEAAEQEQVDETTAEEGENGAENTDEESSP